MTAVGATIRRIYASVIQEFRIEGWSDPRNKRLITAACVLAVAAFVVRMLFWWYTGRTWEDALITVLHSENLVSGLGLTHYLTGQGPVHGFTSPLGVLVPLIGDLVKAGYGLGTVKLVSALCGSLAVIFVAGIGIHPKFGIPRALLILPIGFVALDYNQIMWGMSGMETQMVTTVLLMSIYYLLREKLFATGILLGLCLLARPDMVFWVAIAGTYLLFTRRLETVKAIVPAAVVYLPWLIFTTGYYGSPLPNTIMAKFVGYQGRSWMHQNLSLAGTLHYVLVATRQVFQPLGPCLASHGTGYINCGYGFWISYAVSLFAFIAVCLILLQRRKELLPSGLFVVAYAAYYIFLAPSIAAWYLVPFAAVGVLLSTYGIGRTTSMLKNRNLQRYSSASIAVGYLACMATVLPIGFNTDRQIQLYIEDGVRKEIGLYLSTVMDKGQSVGCECLGYIGYYSRRTVYDFPGLCNPHVVECLRTEEPSQRCLYCMLEHFRPDFMVLRRYEYESCKERCGIDGWVTRDYQALRWFEADPSKTKDIFLIEDNIDTSFVVLKKKGA